jgi:TonB family protein
MNVPFADRRFDSTTIVAAVTLAAMFVFLLGVSGTSLAPALFAQNKKPGREVIHSVKPEYPPIMKSARIVGTVRLNAIVLPNGNVTSIQLVGGNPILAESVVKAVMKWKYAPASSQTSEEVIVNFNANETP